MYILVIYTPLLCLFINYNTYKYINLLTIRKAERKKKITNNEYLCMSNITFYFYFLIKYKKKQSESIYNSSFSI